MCVLENCVRQSSSERQAYPSVSISCCCICRRECGERRGFSHQNRWLFSLLFKMQLNWIDSIIPFDFSPLGFRKNVRRSAVCIVWQVLCLLQQRQKAINIMSSVVLTILAKTEFFCGNNVFLFWKWSLKCASHCNELLTKNERREWNHSNPMLITGNCNNATI